MVFRDGSGVTVNNLKGIVGVDTRIIGCPCASLRALSCFPRVHACVHAVHPAWFY